MSTSSVLQCARPLLAAATCALTLTSVGCLPDPSDFPGPSSRRNGPSRSGGGDGSNVVSVFRQAPELVWEATPRPSPSARRSEVFETYLFNGQCPGFRVFAGDAVGPFGPLGTPPAPPFGVSTSHDSWGPGSILEPVSLGGPSPVVSAWQGLDTYGLARGGCSYLFFPLLTFGRGDPLLIAR